MSILSSGCQSSNKPKDPKVSKPVSNSVKDGTRVEVHGNRSKLQICHTLQFSWFSSTGFSCGYDHPPTQRPCGPRWRYPQRGVELEESELLGIYGGSSEQILGHDSAMIANHDLRNDDDDDDDDDDPVE